MTVNLAGKLIIVIGAVIVISLLYLVLRKETPKHLYRKAQKCHLEGERCYGEGDFGLAEHFYQKASALRKRARGLE